jgi:hypothetical protein
MRMGAIYHRLGVATIGDERCTVTARHKLSRIVAQGFVIVRFCVLRRFDRWFAQRAGFGQIRVSGAANVDRHAAMRSSDGA